MMAWMLILTSCSRKYTDITHPIDMQEDLSDKVSIHHLCRKIELIPLESDGDRLGGLGKMAVSDKRFFFQDGARTIRSWGMDGKRLKTFAVSADISDFSLYEDRAIEVLSGFNVFEYDIESFSMQNKIRIPDTTAVLTSLMRWNGILHFVGYRGNRLFACEYYLDDDTYFPIGENLIVRADLLQEVAAKSRYFRCGTDNYMFYAHSGSVIYVSRFRSPKFGWELSGDDGTPPAIFDNMQMTASMLYGSFRWKGNRYLLMQEMWKERPTIIGQTKGGLCFPLGVIRDNVNYYCCPASELDKYVSRKVLDKENATRLDSLKNKPGFVILKYTLVGK